jgi:outer membrane receptor for ferrienterochelin and colicins
MKKYIIFFFCHLFLSDAMAENPTSRNTDANIIGHVIDKKTGAHLPYITVSLKGTTIGITTDATGHYFLKNLPEGKFILEARFVGYQTSQQSVEIKRGTILEVNFELEESDISLNEVVVSANRNETLRRLAPTQVSILDVRTFDRTNSHTVADGLSFQPGLRVENTCQNCGPMEVRMNGLQSAYSQILIDSRPVFSALAGIYGLEQLPAAMVERIEVVRGGGSALFGSSAIAGTINIITKEPVRNSAQLSHTITSIGGKGNFDNNTSFNAALVSDNHRMGVAVFGQKRDRHAYDHDGDGFSEIPHLNSRTLGFRSFVKTGTYSKLTFEYHSINEFRRGGDRIDQKPHNAYIAEQIESNVDGGSFKYDMFSPDGKQRFSIYSAAQHIKRNSYYGAGMPVDEILSDSDLTEDEKLDGIAGRMNSYGRTKNITYSAGGQYSYDFDKLLFMPSSLTAGLEYTSDDLNDKSGYRASPIYQKIDVGSVFAQNEWKNEMWSFLAGGRLDKHNLLRNAIFSPRANIRYNPVSDVNIRLSYGQGFRAPQLFDEDLHVDLAAGELIIRQLSPDLKEEKSHSISGSVDWYRQVGSAELNFLVEGFYTRLINPFTYVSEEQPDGSTIKTVVNASGAKVYGVNLESRAAYSTLLQLQLGATIQRSHYDEARKWSDDEDDNVEPEKRMMRAPDVYGYFIATVTPFDRFSANLSGKYTGNMLVPYEGGGDENKTVRTSSFFELGWKVAYEVPFYKGTIFEINAGMQNIFNSYQNDFSQGPERISSYIYGPTMPRSYFAGAKLRF